MIFKYGFDFCCNIYLGGGSWGSMSDIATTKTFLVVALPLLLPLTLMSAWVFASFRDLLNCGRICLRFTFRSLKAVLFRILLLTCVSGKLCISKAFATKNCDGGARVVNSDTFFLAHFVMSALKESEYSEPNFIFIVFLRLAWEILFFRSWPVLVRPDSLMCFGVWACFEPARTSVRNTGCSSTAEIEFLILSSCGRSTSQYGTVF